MIFHVGDRVRAKRTIDRKVLSGATGTLLSMTQEGPNEWWVSVEVG